MKWKSRRRDVPERLEPSLSDGASAEEEGLDRFVVNAEGAAASVMAACGQHFSRSDRSQWKVDGVTQR